jgi:transmembrane protein 70
MWKLFWIYKTNRRPLSKIAICNFAYQYEASVWLTAKCHYGSNTADSSRRDIQVYYGNLTPQIRAVKIFSLLSSVAGLASQPILVNQMPNLGTPVVVALFGFVGFFTFVTPFLLHLITRKYVTHIYFNSDTEMYSAVCLNFFLRKKTVNKVI